ncbi:zinc-ribbon domain-containing protein [Companilactobacillus furfuricola]|uniref:zinc-ribbon domain-containing protein n=1 Tax=Companilactobacillus furfuricola TaxID=1462575 RepID=UPI000F7AD961|nr:zinc-ribbon domain-containing protein [Companilactobacillus furfuricola]
MESTIFCPNCGNKIAEGEAFCGECGFNVKKFLAEQEKAVENGALSEDIHTNESQGNASEPINFNMSKESQTSGIQADASMNDSGKSGIEQPTIPAEQTYPKRKSKRAPIIAGLLLVLIIVGGYYAGSKHYSKASQVSALRDEVTSGTTSKMKSALVDSDGKPLSAKQIDALKRLYLASPDATKNIEKEITDNSTKDVFTVTTAGKYFGLFDKYKVKVTPKILFINTNIENPAFFINGKSIAATKASGEYRIADLTPGVYDLKVKGSDNSKSEQVNITPIKKDDTTQLLVKEKSHDDEPTSDYLSHASSFVSNANVDDSSNHANAIPAKKPSGSSANSMYGTYHGSPDLTLNSDGTYTLGSKSGTYSMTQNGDEVSITYYQNGGGSITETYDYDGSELYSDKYGQGWIKD